MSDALPPKDFASLVSSIKTARGFEMLEKISELQNKFALPESETLAVLDAAYKITKLTFDNLRKISSESRGPKN